MTDNIKMLLKARNDAQSAASKAIGALRLAIDEEMKRVLPSGMKILGFEVEYESHDDDRVDVFYAAVPVEFKVDDNNRVRGYKYHDQQGFFGSETPENMLVLDEDEYSPTWLKWRPWEEIFEGVWPSVTRVHWPWNEVLANFDIC